MFSSVCGAWTEWLSFEYRPEKSSKVSVRKDVQKESIDIIIVEQGGEMRRVGQAATDPMSHTPVRDLSYASDRTPSAA
jgi:hypothetical protein